MVYVIFLLLAIITVFVTYKTIVKLLPPFWASFCCFVMSFPQYLLFGQIGGFSESTAIFFQVIGLLCFFQINRKQNISFHLFWVGFSAAGAFFLRPNLIGIWLAMGLFWLYEDIKHREIRFFCKKIFLIFIGFLPLTLLFTTYFLYHNALYNFYDGLIGFNMFEYSQVQSKGLIQNIITVIVHNPFLRISKQLFPNYGIFFAVILLTLFLSKTFKYKRLKLFSDILGFITIWIFIELLLMSNSGRYYPHYYGPLLLPVALFVSILFSTIELKSMAGFIKMAMLSILLVLPTYNNIQIVYNLSKGSRKDINTLIEFVKQNTKEFDNIYSYIQDVHYAAFATKRNIISKYPSGIRLDYVKAECFDGTNELPKLVIVNSNDTSFLNSLDEQYGYTKTVIRGFNCWVK